MPVQYSFITMPSKAEGESPLAKKIKGKLMSFHLPIILVIAIVVGIVFPAPGRSGTALLHRRLLVEDVFHSVLRLYDLYHLGCATRHQFGEGGDEVLGCRFSWLAGM